jgi:magnesium transporter
MQPNPPSFTLIHFSTNYCTILTDSQIEILLQQVDRSQNVWLRCLGIPSHNQVVRISQFFGLKPTRVDKILRRYPLGFDEDVEDCLFSSYQLLIRDQLNIREVDGSVVLGANFLVTFEADELIVFTSIVDQLQNRTIQLQSRSVDYLLYLLLGGTVDSYYSVFDQISWQLEGLEELVLKNAGNESTYRKIATFKQTSRLGRRNIQRIKALFLRVAHGNISWINSEVALLFDQKLIKGIDDLLEENQALQSWMSELIEIQRANMDSNMGNVIHRLTIISAIFLPLQFLTGLYGMNFRHMPELEVPWAYPVLLTGMLLFTITGLLYAKKQKWLR